MEAAVSPVGMPFRNTSAGRRDPGSSELFREMRSECEQRDLPQGSP